MRAGMMHRKPFSSGCSRPRSCSCSSSSSSSSSTALRAGAASSQPVASAVRPLQQQQLVCGQQQEQQQQQQQHSAVELNDIQQQQQPQQQQTSRRATLAALAAAAATTALTASPRAASAGAQPQVPEVGTYLPPAGIDDLVLFVPDARKTPALRAGTVDPSSPYRFALPPSFREGKVANILSGNYCQPRCDEPWTEVLFESPAEGRIVVIVSPLVKLTRVKGAKIEDVGSPEGILNSLGSYITGTTLDVEGGEEVVSVKAERQDDGRMYYYYEINSPYATNGPHSVSSCTTKGDLALVFIASANDKQWARSAERLTKAAQSFRA